MKKYLIHGLLALFVGGFAASCADDKVEYIPITQQKTQAYEEAFKQMIGGEVDPNQDWGFTGLSVAELQELTSQSSQTRISTRSVDEEGGWGISNDYVETFSRSKIDEILSALPEGINASNKLNDYELESKGPIEFSIVYSVTSGVDKVGYYYYNPNADPNSYGGINNPVYQQFVDNIQNNYYFQYGFADGHNWGTPVMSPLDQNKCGEHGLPWTCRHVIDHWNIDQVRAKKYTLNIPEGNIMGFWVKDAWDHMMYSKKSRTNEDNHCYSAIATLADGTYAVGLEDWWQGDFDCNDIVMAINPTEKKPEIINYGQTVTSRSTQRKQHKILVSQGRVFCEDLGVIGLKDLEFNDIVFDARIWLTQLYDETTINGDQNNREWIMYDWKYEADICMLAAGGTIDAKLLGNNVHDLFEGSPGKTTLINTVDGYSRLTTTWDNFYVTPGAKNYHYDITNVINNVMSTAPEGYQITVKDIPIEVLWQTTNDANTATFDGNMQAVGELHATPGEVPHKICLPIGTRWPSERVPFITAYPDFDNWSISEAVAPEFYKNVVTDSLYWGNGCEASLTMTDPYGNPFANDDTDKGKEYYINIGSPEVTETIETSTTFELLQSDIILYRNDEGFDFGDYNTLNVPVYADWNSMTSGKIYVVGSVYENSTPEIGVRDAAYSKYFIGSNSGLASFNGIGDFEIGTDDKYYFGCDNYPQWYQGTNHLCIDGKRLKVKYVVYRKY